MGAIWSEAEKGIRKVKTIQPLPNCLSKVSLIFLEKLLTKPLLFIRLSSEIGNG